VVGISALFPGSTEVTGFWRDILEGRDLMSDVPPHYWLVDDYYSSDPSAVDKTYGRRGAFLQPVDFDPMEFGVPPALLPSTDTSQLLALVVAKRVLEDAATGQFAAVDRSRISVILGVAAGLELLGEMASRLQRPVWVKALRESGLPEDQVQAACDRIASHYVPWNESTFPGLLGNVVAGRIANRFDLGGTNCTVDAACASSLSALKMAADELYLGDSDLVITGGVDTTNDPFIYMCFSKTPALSVSGDCRPFAEGADGTMLGEGIGMVALRRLEDAERDGNRIYAVIRGIGTSSDGRAKSVYAPAPDGQARALRRAYQRAGYSPATVELVEAHGTGTVAGDTAEVEALSSVFAESGRLDGPWCALGSIKSQVGHTKGAAGVAGLLKAVLALHHQVLPPTIKVKRPDPRLHLEESPFYLSTRARPWISGADHPRRASVSSFGFGGSNFHVALEEYRGEQRAHRLRTAPTELVVLAASGAVELAALCRDKARELDGAQDLVSRARQSQEAMDRRAPARLALVAADVADLQRKLSEAAEQMGRGARAFSLPAGVHFAEGADPGRVAFLFPGQGSQHLYMGADLAMAFEEVREVWDAHADPLADGLSLHEVVFPRPVFSEEAKRAQEARLVATEWAQPAIGLSSLGTLALLERLGVCPDCAGGHSFGELTALCAAGVLAPADLIRLARRRGELMAGASSVPGAMLAVARPRAEVETLLSRLGLQVTMANHNSPRQVVLAGETEAMRVVEERLSAERIAVRRLPVSTAFHSPLVHAARAPLAEFLRELPLALPRFPVYSNVEAAPYPGDAEGIRSLLVEQIVRPVLFADEIEAMVAAGVRTFVEAGPGSVLSGLVEQCLEGRPHLAVSLDLRGQHGVTQLWNALGRLWVGGLGLDLGALWRRYRPSVEERPRPAFSVRLDGTNYGRRYPPPGGAADLPRANPPRTEEPRQRGSTPQGETAATHEAHDPAERGAGEMPLDGEMGLASIQAYQDLQRQTSEAQAAFQRAMTESHLAFLRSAEASSRHLAAILEHPSVCRTEPAFSPSPPPASCAEPWSATSAPTVPASPVDQGSPPDSASLEELVLGVVADKTGYPREILTLEMSLEADLGIDSIKRVEILSAIKERAPWLPEVNVAEVVSLGTLGQVLGALQHHLEGARVPGPEDARPSPSAETSPASPPAAPMELEPVPPRSGEEDLEELLLAVVSEKTGYPREVLGLAMSLEADLGIDSIKRVEILSAVKERAPWLPEVDAGQMAGLRTLGEVLGQVRGLTPREEGESGGNGSRGSPASGPGSRLGQRGHDEAREPRVVRQVLRAVDGPADPARPPAGAWQTGIEIVDDGIGVAPLLAEELAVRGVVARVVSLVTPTAEGVIFLGGLREGGDERRLRATNREAFCAAQTVAARLASRGGLFVTVQDTGGDFGLSGACGERAWLGGLSGLCKTAAAEWPQGRVKAVDVERDGRPPRAVAAALAREILDGGPELEVGLRSGGRRLTLQAGFRDAEPGDLTLDAQSVVVATGGGRGITAAALVELAQTLPARFVLLGRTLLEEEPACCRAARDDASLKRVFLAEATRQGRRVVPAEITRRVQRIVAGREVRATMEALEAAGAHVVYHAADVRDPASVVSVLSAVRRKWGPISAVIHGAGVVRDRLIADQTEDRFDEVFDTKVVGLHGLLAATAEDPLRCICLFSSAAAWYGNVGQGDYAMANEVLNKVACAEATRRGPGCLVRAINWGPWEGGMVTPALGAHFARAGVPLIPLEVGARRFSAELRCHAPDEAQVLIRGEAAGEDSERRDDVGSRVPRWTAPTAVEARQGRQP
jgi:acyl transferase domain-containing protein